MFDGYGFFFFIHHLNITRHTVSFYIMECEHSANSYILAIKNQLEIEHKLKLENNALIASIIHAKDNPVMLYHLLAKEKKLCYKVQCINHLVKSIPSADTRSQVERDIVQRLAEASVHSYFIVTRRTTKDDLDKQRRDGTTALFEFVKYIEAQNAAQIEDDLQPDQEDRLKQKHYIPRRRIKTVSEEMPTTKPSLLRRVFGCMLPK